PPAREAGEHRGHVVGRAAHQPVGALRPEAVHRPAAAEIRGRARDEPHRPDAPTARRIDAGGALGSLARRVVALRDAPDGLRKRGMARHVRDALAVEEDGAAVGEPRHVVGRPAPGGKSPTTPRRGASLGATMLGGPDAGPRRTTAMKTALLAVCTTLTLLAAPALAQPLPQARPEQVGLSSDRLAQVGRVLREEIEKGKFPGAIALVARKGRIAYYETFGVRDPETRAPMTRDSISRIYSMTKPITSVAVMMLQEQGRLVLTDPVSKFLPQLAHLEVAGENKGPSTGQTIVELVPAQREITIQDLLRHTSGFTYGARTTNTAVKEAYARAGVDSRDLSNAELVDRLATVPLAHQ